MSATYVAIIMDGNGRWAEQHGVPVSEGHRAGADTVKARLRDAVDLGVRELTIYSFSTENWSRPQDEVDALMALFSARIIDETPELHEEGVRMRFVGRREGVLPELLEQMDWAEETTAQNTTLTLFVAFNYGGRSEILDAAERYTGGGEEAFRQLLYAPEMHDPDLLIRTSGEQRISNYLLWQAAYSRAALHRRAVAGLLARGLRGGAVLLRSARAPVRGALMATDASSREPRKKGTSDLIPRIAGRDPGDRVRGRDHLLRRVGVRRGHRRAGARLRARARATCSPGRGRCGWRRCWPLIGLTVAGTIGDERQVLLALVCSLPLTFFLAVLSPVRERITASIAVTMLIIVWIGLGVAFATMLRGLDHGGALVVMVLLGTFFGDTFAYFGGRLLGRRKLAPRISPNKTVEGLLCGIVFGTLIVWYWSRTYDGDWISGTDGLLLGLAVVIAAPIGDLFESLIKRDMGTKDTGTLFGAHGGALDRVDAALFALVAGYYVWLAVA